MRQRLQSGFRHAIANSQERCQKIEMGTNRSGKWLVGQITGAVDMLRHRMRVKQGYPGPFNGQRKRIAIIEALMAMGNFGCAIETGTFRGNTTKYLADHFPRTVSIEKNPRYAAFSRLRLRTRKNLTIVDGDSAEELPAVLRKQPPGTPLFVYLDAHRRGRLPLVDELQSLDRSGFDYVAVIDDFKVPGDDGYGFDVYPGKEGGEVGPPIVFEAIPRLERLWVPAASSENEAGKVRGTGFLASPTMETLLSQLERSNLLRPVTRGV